MTRTFQSENVQNLRSKITSNSPFETANDRLRITDSRYDSERLRDSKIGNVHGMSTELFLGRTRTKFKRRSPASVVF